VNLRWLHALNALLFIGLWVFVLATYGGLPDQVPQHIGPDGVVTRWTDRESGMWFLLPILLMTQIVLMYGIASATSSAQGMNVPHKKRLLALPREAQAFALAPMRLFMYLLATWMIVLSWTIQLMMWRAAHAGGSAGGSSLWLLIAVGLAPLAGVAVLGRAVGRRIDALESVTAHGGARD